jgi:hypothetical protein
MQNDLYKKPGLQEELTSEQLLEYARCFEDPVYFINNYVYIRHPTKGKVLFKTYPYQDRMIRAFHENRFTINKCPRQAGKTTVIGAFLLWYSQFHEDASILVASNKNSNAMEIMARITFAYEELPMWLKAGTKYATKHSLDFDNGSVIVSQATTENTGRGMSISLLMLDELAFVKRSIQEEMWTSLAPTLSTGGACIVSSTPNGDDDLFATLWTGAELNTNGFIPISVGWDEHPDRDENFKREMIAKVGELKWRQEYECEMLSSDALLISSILLAQMRGEKPVRTDMGFDFWIDQFNPKCQYYVGADIATGVGGDYSTIQIVEMPSMRQVGQWRSNKVNIPRFYAHIKWVLNHILTNFNQSISRQAPEVYWSYENNGVGAAIHSLYFNDEKFPDATLMSDNMNTSGFCTTGKKKVLACMDLKNLVEKRTGGLKVNSNVLLAELKNFVAKKGGYEARSGATDDLVSAMLIVMHMIKKAADHDEAAFKLMYDNSADLELEEYGSEDPIPVVF